MTNFQIFLSSNKILTPAERVEYCHDNAADEDDQPRYQQYVPAYEERVQSQSTCIRVSEVFRKNKKGVCYHPR
jgi:hypothetical protein